ncbi:MAG: 30S ribosomal protein S20 [Lachnospiraceae bacterium]|nr:30S ribosomal protein S20 [Lachnospiraceae bacterium]
MANIKSAKKRVLVSNERAARNKAVKSEVKTYVKKVYAAIESGDKAEAEKAFRDAEVKLTKAATKGVLHKNTASRKVSRLAKAVDAMA